MREHTMSSREDIESEVEPVEYLTRSPSRLKVLTLIDETPRSRRELRDSTDISRVTLSRVLSNFEDRGWIERTNGEYEVTPEGSYIATELDRLLGNITTLQELDGAMAWLPVAEFDFDLACLGDATVTTAAWEDHTAQIRRVADTITGSDRIVATGSGISRDVLEAIWQATVNGDASFVGLLDDTALDIAKSDPELRRRVRDIAASENADVRRYEGDETPLLMVSICDDTVVLCDHEQDGPPSGTLETTNATVRAWAESYVEAIERDSAPVDPERFED